MKYQFKRTRSDFWINVYENEDSYTISTNTKYVDIINYSFPVLENNSPTKWKESENYENVYNLWLPEGCIDDAMKTDFLNWCEEATSDVLWLGLNRNIKEYFDDELDYCIASDFNIVFGEGRTEIGEAEYQLKYNIDNLSISEREEYSEIIMSRMLSNCKYIPIDDGFRWCVSPMPATEDGTAKLAWLMADKVSKQLRLPFVTPLLTSDKPQMKQLSIKEKIETWEEIYYNDGVSINNQIRGKNIIVIDDLYQSGATMWEYAKFLKELGARRVFGVVCVKSLKDSDNT